MDFLESKTIINLARTFAGECQDGARYQFLADTATKEGQAYIAEVLKDIATNEMAHAKKVFECITSKTDEVIKNINIEAGFPFKAGDLTQMLKYEIENETSEAESVYTAFAEIARDEGFKDIYDLFIAISEVEKTHMNILEEIYKGLKTKKLYKCTSAIKWKCSNCGHIAAEKVAWSECPLCGMEQGFVRFTLRNTCGCRD